MKIGELLETAIKTGDMIVSTKRPIAMKYNDATDYFQLCCSTTGNFNDLYMDINHNRVKFTREILCSDEWKLVQIKSEYKIGDEFLIPELTRVISDTSGSVVMKQTKGNVIGKIINRHIGEDDGCEYFLLDVHDGFGTIVVGTHFLKKCRRLV